MQHWYMLTQISARKQTNNSINYICSSFMLDACISAVAQCVRVKWSRSTELMALSLYSARRKYERIFETERNRTKRKILKFPSAQNNGYPNAKRMYPNIYSILCQIVLESFPNTIEPEHYEKFYVLMGGESKPKKKETVAWNRIFFPLWLRISYTNWPVKPSLALINSFVLFTCGQ